MDFSNNKIIKIQMIIYVNIINYINNFININLIKTFNNNFKSWTKTFFDKIYRDFKMELKRILYYQNVFICLFRTYISESLVEFIIETLLLKWLKKKLKRQKFNLLN